MALRQTTGCVESLLCLIGLDWDVPDFSTLSRRQKALAVNIPYRGAQGPLHLLIPSRGLRANHCRAVDSTGIKVEGGMRASMAVPNVVYDARSTSGSTSKHWRSERSRSLVAMWAMPRCCPNCSAKFLPIRRSPVSLPSLTVCRRTVDGQRTGPATPASAMTPSLIAGLLLSSRHARMQSHGRLSQQVLSRATRPCGRRDTWAARSGDDGADTTVEAASKQRCTV